MHNSDVSTNIWLQNLAALVTASIVSFIVLSRKKTPKRKSFIFVLTSIVLLILTFFDAGAGNVHRYLSIGVVHLNIASIVLPILLIELERMLTVKNWWSIALVCTGVSALLFLQPDASQLTAFSLASLIFLGRRVTKSVQYAFLALSVLLSILSWFFLDKLPPVDYVEGILLMTKEIGIVVFVLALLSIILLPLPFFLLRTTNNQSTSISLGVYFSIVLIATFFGNFPVPLLGYGVSPFISYSIAIIWLIKHYRTSQNERS